MKANFKNVLIKLEMIERIFNGEKIRNICNDPKFLDILGPNTKIYSSKNEYSSYQALYRVYNNFIKESYK